MKKVICYIGSRQSKSNTIYFANSIIKYLKNESPESIETKIYTPLSLPIESCKEFGKSIVNNMSTIKNDLEKFEEELSEADLFIFGSPVYSHNISGDTKMLIDHFSHWSHILKLLGIPSVVISTCDSNGHLFSINYLTKMLTHFGSKVIISKNAAVGYPEQLYNEEWMNESLKEIYEKIEQEWNDDSMVNNTIEKIFETNKKIILFKEKNGQLDDEIKYWRESGLINATSAQEYIKKKGAHFF